MLTFTTPTTVRAVLNPITGAIISHTYPAPLLHVFTPEANSRTMAIHPRFTSAWRTGDTATPFAIIVRHQDGTARADIVSATFTLTNRSVEPATKLIDAQPCDTSLALQGVLSYQPIPTDLDTACLFSAQYVATLDTGDTLPTFIIEGEIEQSL